MNADLKDVEVANLKISTRLFLGFGLILFLMLVIALAGENRVSIIDSNMKEVGQGSSLKQRFAINFRGSVHDRAISIRDAVLVDDQVSLQQHLDDIDKLKEFYTESDQAMKDLMQINPLAPQENELLTKINQIEEQTLALTERVIQLRKAGQNEQAKAVLLTEVSPAYSAWLKSINNFIDYQEGVIKAKVGQVEEIADSFKLMMITITLLAIAIGLIVAIWNVRSINKPVAVLMEIMTRVQNEGDFSQRAHIRSEDEIGKMAQAFNKLLESTQNAVLEVNGVVGAIAKGQFDRRITADLKGDLNTLKLGVNGSAESVDQTMQQLTKAMNALKNGEFSEQIDAKFEGDFGLMVGAANSAITSLNDTISGIINVMQKMEQGKFEYRVEVQAQGDLLTLKNAINLSMDSLESAITDITHILVALENGDLTQTITAEYTGDLKILKDAVNSSLTRLDGIVSIAVEAADIVTAAALEVSDGSNTLSQRVQEQAAALEQTSATMDEMNSAVQANTENAQQTSQVAQDVQKKATQGASVMQETIGAMNAIQKSSHKIADIVSLIDGIAFQTNLLALNAAVEAARAGDHGRGFAVVAGEVRALAQKSAEAAKDIKVLIEESVARIDEGTKLAAQSGEVLQDINESIHGVTSMINNIANASSEQSKGIKQVHIAISQIDSVTQQNATLVQETTFAAESMSEQSKNLKSEMSIFKTTSDNKYQTRSPQLALESKPRTLN